jgi:hypothetical protein
MVTVTATALSTFPNFDFMYGTNTNFSTTSATYVVDTQLGSMSMQANSLINWCTGYKKTTAVHASDGIRLVDSTATYVYKEHLQPATAPATNYIISWTNFSISHGNNGTVTIRQEIKSGNGNTFETTSLLGSTAARNILFVQQDPTDATAVHPQAWIFQALPSGTRSIPIPIKMNVDSVKYLFVNQHIASATTSSVAHSMNCMGGQQANTKNVNSAGARANDGTIGEGKMVTKIVKNVVTDQISVYTNVDLLYTANANLGNAYQTYLVILIKGTRIEVTA